MKTTLNQSSLSGQINSPYMKSLSMEQLIMKALLKNIPIFLVTVAMIFLVACSSEPKRQSAGEYIDDTVITTRVKAAIIADDDLKASEINVETYKGVVQLSGFVSSSSDKSRAAKVAKEVKGVESVKNDIRIK